MLTNKIESIVVVRHEHGVTGTLRFSDPLLDKIINCNSRFALMNLIENYIRTGRITR